MVWLILAVLLAIDEIAIFVPVIITQKEEDEASGLVGVLAITDVVGLRACLIISQVAYSVRRTGAFGLLGQTA